MSSLFVFTMRRCFYLRLTLSLLFARVLCVVKRGGAVRLEERGGKMQLREETCPVPLMALPLSWHFNYPALTDGGLTLEEKPCSPVKHVCLLGVCLRRQFCIWWWISIWECLVIREDGRAGLRFSLPGRRSLSTSTDRISAGCGVAPGALWEVGVRTGGMSPGHWGQGRYCRGGGGTEAECKRPCLLLTESPSCRWCRTLCRNTGTPGKRGITSEEDNTTHSHEILRHCPGWLWLWRTVH